VIADYFGIGECLAHLDDELVDGDWVEAALNEVMP